MAKGSEADFEAVWLGRDSHLGGVPGFVEFHLLKGPEREDHVLYASHTIWRSFADFEAWTRSEAFRAAHRECWRQKAALSRPSAFEGFEVIQTVCGLKAARPLPDGRSGLQALLDEPDQFDQAVLDRQLVRRHYQVRVRPAPRKGC